LACCLRAGVTALVLIHANSVTQRNQKIAPERPEHVLLDAIRVGACAPQPTVTGCRQTAAAARAAAMQRVPTPGRALRYTICSNLQYDVDSPYPRS